MDCYSFSIILDAHPADHDAFDALADSIYGNQCDDATVASHRDGIEVMFDREARTWADAVESAVADLEKLDLRVIRVEMARACIPA